MGQSLRRERDDTHIANSWVLDGVVFVLRGASRQCERAQGCAVGTHLGKHLAKGKQAVISELALR